MPTNSHTSSPREAEHDDFTSQSHYARLRWHCRRGMRELDILLERFLESRYAALTDADKALFSRFLEEPNERIVDWVLEGVEPEKAEYIKLVGWIQQYR
uniref:FAD assembly factor SdhE n=1 Tax=Candidatus Kentrum sp. DK TaxID=2126562 RepID=A0A450SHG0_9GAMM|nr:MAG: antitoxin CptB [Candidatus Kentron sp. DK]VFJ52621.1 MAG: antitoxin CptB [Candidatus Kentron sp. DK]